MTLTNEQPSRNAATLIGLQVGSGIPIVFFITTIVCGFILGDYNHLTRMVSELGASGTRSQYAFSTGLLICSALSIVFIVGLYRTCRIVGISTVPVILILSYSISIAGAAVFPLPLRLHMIMGMPSVILVLSPFLSLFLWSKSGYLLRVKEMSAFSFFVMSLGFLAFIPDILEVYPGLKQRLFHLGWSIWFLYLSYGFTRLFRQRVEASVKTAPPRAQ
jgi:hypothetical protein